MSYNVERIYDVQGLGKCKQSGSKKYPERRTHDSRMSYIRILSDGVNKKGERRRKEKYISIGRATTQVIMSIIINGWRGCVIILEN